MIQLRIHAAPDPKNSWLEVDGRKVEGVDLVVATDHVAEHQLTFTVQAHKEQGIEIVWEDWDNS